MFQFCLGFDTEETDGWLDETGNGEEIEAGLNEADNELDGEGGLNEIVAEEENDGELNETDKEIGGVFSEADASLLWFW